MRSTRSETGSLWRPGADKRRSDKATAVRTSILIVEDEGIVALDLKRCLERFGYRVADVVSTGEDAIERAAALQPDLVLMDIRLRGGVDGIEAAGVIRSRYAVPVIFVTAFADQAVLDRATDAQPFGYLVKPLEGEEVHTAIEVALLRHKGEAALAEKNRRLAFLNWVAHTLTATYELDQVMDRVLNEVCTLLRAGAAALWLVDVTTGEVACSHIAGLYDEGVRGTRLGHGVGALGWVANSGKTLALPDVWADERGFHFGGAQVAQPLHAWMGIPLLVKGVVIGVLEVAGTGVDQFNDEDVTLLESLASSAAVAIDNVSLVEMLRQRTADLESQNAEMDAFAHTVAHDLKAPLSIIAGFADVLEDQYDDLPAVEFKRHLRSIASTAFRMNNIIEELLLLAQLRKAEVQFEPVQMDSVVRGALQRLGSMVEEHQAQISLPDRWPPTLGYSSWLEEVWTNYISNAIKYGGRPPCVELGATVQPDRSVRFWVRDNGPGIPKEDQARLFQPFTRLSPRRASGHGLGLSIVGRIIEKLGGQVGIESELGQGSTFSFTLPVVGSRIRSTPSG